jgi:AraC family transcriptional regulator of adaptative response/methylated-DNA-[protein]-cysteine methyltransferase
MAMDDVLSTFCFKKIPNNHFVKVERMTPDEYENGGEELTISYSYTDSPFGKTLIASTEKGICFNALSDNKVHALSELKSIFPEATYLQQPDKAQQAALRFLEEGYKEGETNISLHIKASDFQLNVWNALLNIPMGKLTTYKEIACSLNMPRACRAVGTAVGDNPVAFFIPCHRVIRSTGELGQYHWGADKKAIMIQWEKNHASL